MSLARSTKCRNPSASKQPTSPVRNQSPSNAASVAAGVAEIFAHHRRPAGLARAHQQLARLAPGHVIAVRIDRADLDAHDRPPGRPRPRLLLPGPEPGDVPRLGLGEEGVETDMGQRRPEALLQRHREDLAGGGDQAQRGSRPGAFLELRHHHAEHGRHAARDGHLLALDQGQRLGRVEARLHDQPAADDQHVGEAADPGAVRHRRGRHHHVVLAEPHSTAFVRAAMTMLALVPTAPLGRPVVPEV